MKLLDVEYKHIVEPESDTHFWYYCPERADFFVTESNFWQEMTCNAYVLDFDGHHVYIPEQYYILIGDYDSGLDTIKAMEIAGRDFDVFCFDNKLNEHRWPMERIKVVGYEEDVSFEIPMINKPFPILVDNNRSIIVSRTDLYSDMKNKGFGDL